MKVLCVCALWFSICSLLIADEPKLWDDGRVTPEQPFPAKVIGAVPSWGGAVVILREDGKDGRYCVAKLFMGSFTYRIVETKNFDKEEWIKKGATFIEPQAEVERFSWSMGVHKIGRIFGEEDFVRKWYAKSKKESEQEEADRHPTAK